MLAYDRLGAGPPLLLLHPLGADRGMWDPVLPALASSYDVCAVDLPGFGGSPVLSEPATPGALAGAVARWLDEQGIEKVAAVGNSLGAWVAFELALLGRASSVVAIAPAGLWARPLAPKRGTARRIARALLPMLPRLCRSERGRRLLLSGSVAHPERLPAAAAERLVRAYATSPGQRDTNDRMREAHFTRLAEIDVPVTVAWCERDRIVSPRPVPPDIAEVVLLDCGHIPTWDAPDRVVELVTENVRHEMGRHDPCRSSR
jgi:pimeloyl-ACP methyl ester carboxylesterase